jgi:rod shape-determining protein MreD
MKNSISRDIVLFISFLIAQILLTNFIDFGPLVFISVYPLYILTRPRHINNVVALVSAFILGFLTDYFTGSILGINAAAATLLAFAKPHLVRIVIRKSSDEGPLRPGIADLGLHRFLIFLLTGLFLHHIAIVWLENFAIQMDLYSFLRIVISFVLNFILLTMIEFGIFYKNWR